ncbi:MAG: glycosyltransferase family 9 protein [Ramlibacter sp.]|nr:glycosyltransferase family 9 protein [Ramlibacter sp.]
MTMARQTPPETASPPSAAWLGTVAVALAALGFFAPFSSAGVAIAMGALVLLALLRVPALWAPAPWRNPVMAAGLLLLAFIAVHSLAFSGWTEVTLHAVNRYHELLFAPLLLVLMADARHRLLFMRALMAGAALLALVHWVSLVEPGLRESLATRRISAGFAVAVCAFLVLMRARASLNPWRMRALAAFLAATVLFAIDGRTGHVVLLALASCAAWLHSPPRYRWAAALAGPVVVVVLAMSSSAVKGRLQETLNGGARNGQTEALSSTGIRIELLQLAADLAIEHPVTGVGYAHYAQAHERAAQARYANDPSGRLILQESWIRASNPHNEYLMQLVGGGAVALALFLAWLGLAFRAALRSTAPADARGMLAGVALAFAVGSLFNSMLMDFGEGHLYMALLAWLLAENGAVRSSPQGDVKRVVVIATRQIGDVLLTTPLIRRARDRWPQARIEVLGFAGTLGMLRGNADVAALVETPARPGWQGMRALVGRLWRRYDLALIADPGDRAHLLGWIAARRRHGIVPARSGSNWWKRALLDHVVVAAGDLGAVHTAVEKQALLPAAEGAAAQPAADVIAPPAAPLPPAAQALLQPGAIVVHAPSMWPYKQWPLAHFGALVRALLDEGRQVVLTGSSGERDQSCIEPLRALAPPPALLDLSGQLDFNQLVTLFQGASLYIGPDTSVTHLAAATGVPVIAIFGPTNPLRWAPWPRRAGGPVVFARSEGVQQVGNVTVLQGSQACVPCGRAGCEDHRQSRSDCLVDITPARVLDQARAVLASRPLKSIEIV